MKSFEPEIQSVALVPSSGGRFEISVNGELVFSKLNTGRQPEPGEVVGLIKKFSRKKIA